MTAIELLREGADYAYGEFCEAIAGIDEPHAWATPVGLDENEYLHTDGSIYAIVLHVATVKRMYGNLAFEGATLRWREIADELDAIEPSWAAAKQYLDRAHASWMASWAGLADAELEREVQTNSTPKTAWQVIRLMNHHDSYHAGQLAYARFLSATSTQAPAAVAEDIRTYCRDSKYW